MTFSLSTNKINVYAHLISPQGIKSVDKLRSRGGLSQEPTSHDVVNPIIAMHLSSLFTTFPLLYGTYMNSPWHANQHVRLVQFRLATLTGILHLHNQRACHNNRRGNERDDSSSVLHSERHSNMTSNSIPRSLHTRIVHHSIHNYCIQGADPNQGGLAVFSSDSRQ